VIGVDRTVKIEQLKMKQVFAPVFRKASKECFAFLEGSPERLGKAVSSRAFASGPLTLEKLPPGVPLILEAHS